MWVRCCLCELWLFLLFWWVDKVVYFCIVMLMFRVGFVMGMIVGLVGCCLIFSCEFDAQCERSSGFGVC